MKLLDQTPLGSLGAYIGHDGIRVVHEASEERVLQNEAFHSGLVLDRHIVVRLFQWMRSDGLDEMEKGNLKRE